MKNGMDGTLLHGVAPRVEFDLEITGQPCALSGPLPHILLLLLGPLEGDVVEDQRLIRRCQPGNAQRDLHPSEHPKILLSWHAASGLGEHTDRLSSTR